MTIRVLRKSDPVASQQNQLPLAWVQSTYAPGFPIQPFVGTDETKLPRAIDYPISVNASLQPRIGYGLMGFKEIATVYETIAEVRMPVSMSLRQLTGFPPHLIDDEGNEVDDEHPYQWLCESPDRRVPFDVWLTRFMKSSDIFDAGCFHLRRDGDAITALTYLDGSTIFVIIDEHGNLPKAKDYDLQVAMSREYGEKVLKFRNQSERHQNMLRNNLYKLDDGRSALLTPAFAQVIKGTPFAWYTEDEIWYKPRSRRYDAPYGETFIEQAFPWILIIANITGFELAHYREGNLPEGLFQAPEGWTLDRISAFEDAFNLRSSSGPAERQRSRFVPAGTAWKETKKPDFPKELYQKAFNNLVMSFGYPPSEFGEMSGKGLGGKDMGDLLQDKAFRDAIVPRKTYVENALNNVLQTVGIDDAKVELAIPSKSTDPDKEREALFNGVAHGIYTLNDALGQLGFDPMEGSMLKDHDGNPMPNPEHIGNKHLMIVGSALYVVEDLTVNGGVAVPTVEPSKPGEEIAPGVVAQPQADEPQTERQFSEARDKIKQIMADGKLSTKTYSIPRVAIASTTGAEVSKGVVTSEGVNPNASGTSAKPADNPMPHETPIEPPSGVDAGEWRMGMEEELEHVGTVGNDPKIIAGLVADHLREDPHYYSHLKQLVTKLQLADLRKHCGVCPEDDAYFGAPIAREVKFDFPSGAHVNEVEIIALCPEGLPPKPALWKPEGGELDVLREHIGGPLYPREEAAYLLDRSLGFHLVPVAYVAECDGEMGAALYYSMGSKPSENISAYAPEWIERAGVLDYIECQIDRNSGNWLTHPDEPNRPLIIDNGLGFPSMPSVCYSPFVSAMVGKPLSTETLGALRLCVGDAATWKDITELIGDAAAGLALERAKKLLEQGQIEGVPAELLQTKDAPGEIV